MTQAEIDRQEWGRAENWRLPILGLYASARDSRVWVPKRRPGLGWTINLGHPRAKWWIAGIVAAAAAAGLVLGRHLA